MNKYINIEEYYIKEIKNGLDDVTKTNNKLKVIAKTMNVNLSTVRIIYLEQQDINRTIDELKRLIAIAVIN